VTLALVTPSYNKARYVRRCVQSVLDQGQADFDYWVLDACSTDGSVDLLRDAQARSGGRLNLIVEKDAGQADAINRGFSLARGDVLGWLNADDFYLPGALARVQAFFDAHPEIDLVYGRVRLLDGALRYRKTFPWWRHDARMLRSFDYIPQPATFWRRRVWDAVGPLDTGLNWGFDWDFFVRASQRFRVACVRDRLADVVLDGTHKTATGGVLRTRELARIAHRYGGRLNPTYLYCNYVLALNRLAAPLLRSRVGKAVADPLVFVASAAPVLPLRALGVHVMF
jgi:glycosyltransferase involved in cell wall biosynthesis